jgi:hypothetical protein
LARVYARLISRYWFAPDVFRYLAEEHVPIVVQVLAKPETAEAVFVAAFIRDAHEKGPAVRQAGVALHALRMFPWSPGTREGGRKTVAWFASDPRAVSASQEVVALYGFDTCRHIAVLAADGSPESADILLPLATQALNARDSRLEELAEWLVLFAHSSHLQPCVDALVAADGPREVRRHLRELGATGRDPHLRFEMASDDGLARVVLALQTAQMPSEKVEVFLERDGSSKRFSWGDSGSSPSKLKLISPRSLALIPRWLVEVARVLGIHWDPTTLALRGTLRGEPRERTRKWFLSGMKRA